MTDLSAILECLFYLVLAGLFTAILESFTISGAAGLDRLTGKYPASEKLLREWTPRWTRLQALHMLFAVGLQIAAITKGTLILLPLREPSPLLFLAGAALLFTGFLVLVLILPIAVSEAFADRITTSLLGVTTVLTRPLFFLTAPVALLEQSLLEKFLGKTGLRYRPSEREEILSLIDQKGGHAGIDEDEREIIRSVFDFTETVVREVMTPRVDVVAVEDTTLIETAVHELVTTGHTRFPVYHDSMDVIVGMLHVRDLLKSISAGRGGEPVRSVMQETLFIPESGSIADLLDIFRKGHHRMAVVVDEFGGTAGIVTMEDVIEELVGDIRDEGEDVRKEIEHQRDGTAFVNPRLPVDEVNEALGIHIPEHDEYDSAGGFVLHALGRIPKPRERVAGPDFEIVVHSANERQILRLRILPKPAEAA
ncbi:MAG: hemolysin family protein [Kiritimatiellia bacterium]